MVMTVKDIRKALDGLDDELEIYFRRVAPLCGNIEGAYHLSKSHMSFFGQSFPCLIIEPASPYRGERDDDAEPLVAPKNHLIVTQGSIQEGDLLWNDDVELWDDIGGDFIGLLVSEFGGVARKA